MYLGLPLFLIFSLDLTAYSLVPSDRLGVLLTEPLPWWAALLGTFGGDPSPASILGALPFTLRLWLPRRGRCVAAAPAGPPDPLSCPSGHPDGKFSAARSEGGRLRWRLQTRLAAATPSAPLFFFFFSQPLLVRCCQPGLPVLHGKRRLFTALYSFSCWALILSKTSHHLTSIVTRQQPTKSKWNGNDPKAAPSKLGWWPQLRPGKASLQTRLWQPSHSGVLSRCFCKLDQTVGCRSLWAIIRAAWLGNDCYEIRYGRNSNFLFTEACRRT